MSTNTKGQKQVSPVEDHSAVVTDVKRPHVQSGDFRVPVQILMNLQHRNITRKRPSALHRADRWDRLEDGGLEQHKEKKKHPA